MILWVLSQDILIVLLFKRSLLVENYKAHFVQQKSLCEVIITLLYFSVKMMQWDDQALEQARRK